MLNEMLNMMNCPVCGRRNICHHPLPAYWCPFCGGGDTRILNNKIKILDKKVEIIKQLLEWESIIHDIDDGQN